jgi:Bacteriophage Sf6, terminase small subunit-like
MVRSTDYSDEVGAEICARVARGKSIADIRPTCRTRRRSGAGWVAGAHQAFREMYAPPREERGEALVEAALSEARANAAANQSGQSGRWRATNSTASAAARWNSTSQRGDGFGSSDRYASRDIQVVPLAGGTAAAATIG